jgi:DNA-binding MarR family transcriptional regulator
MTFMSDDTANDLINQLIKITYELGELEKRPIDFGTGEKLYPSEIHTIDAVGDNFDTVTAVSEKFGITKGAVSQVIIKLHKKGYVQKNRNEAYSKEIILSLTDKGLKAYAAHKKLHRVMDTGLLKLFDGYSEEWILTFEDMLSRFEKQIDRYMRLGEDIEFL